MTQHTIKSIEVVKPGSPPDIDTDYNTVHREPIIENTRTLYGPETSARIVTHGFLKAKSAFKDIASIYGMPFQETNRISALLPGVKDGKECPLAEVFNPESERYPEGTEFRDAVSAPEWKKVVEGALAVEGRTKSIGTHACGVILSSHPLSDVIPVSRDNKQNALTEYEYPACENLGLIKIDFLGLDTVDIIQNTVQAIIDAGKEPPCMPEIIAGDMDDQKTYAMLSAGHTIAVFQLSSPGVQELLRKMNPTKVDHIAAITALYRPGPMSMNAHTKYADRIGGRESIEPIHPEFKGTVLDNILEPTASLIVFQEQVIEIAQKICGMTEQEGDVLRKAIGKKKTDVMMSMQPKFLQGGQDNGYSLEAMNMLWEKVVEFSKYAFNKAHSYSYAILAYQTAYLKANYPVEFMATCLEQTLSSGNKQRRFEYAKEAERMGITFESINVNASGSKIKANPHKPNSILYGFSGVEHVSQEAADTIVQERYRAGQFTSVEDFILRCHKAAVTNKKIFENIALAGGFDVFGASRKKVFEAVSDILSGAKRQLADTDNIFAGLDDLETASEDYTGEDFAFLQRLQLEGSKVGMYLSAHPLSKIKKRIPGLRTTTIGELIKSTRPVSGLIMCAVSSVVSETRSGRKTTNYGLEDGTGYFVARPSRDLTDAMNMWEKQQDVKKAYMTGKTFVSDVTRSTVLTNRAAVPALEAHGVYSLSVTFYPPSGDSSGFMRINTARRVPMASDGTLPVRIRFDVAGIRDVEGYVSSIATNLKEKFSATNGKPIWYTIYNSHDTSIGVDSPAVYIDALNNLDSPAKDGVRSWPPPRTQKPEAYQMAYPALADALTYREANTRVAVSNSFEVALGEYVDFADYDFGVFRELPQ